MKAGSPYSRAGGFVKAESRGVQGAPDRRRAGGFRGRAARARIAAVTAPAVAETRAGDLAGRRQPTAATD